MSDHPQSVNPTQVGVKEPFRATVRGAAARARPDLEMLTIASILRLLERLESSPGGKGSASRALRYVEERRKLAGG